MEDLTPEQIQKSISAAFDSVNLINELNAKESLTDEEQDILLRNQQHLTIMMGKSWFSDALTEQQKTEINNNKL